MCKEQSLLMVVYVCHVVDAVNLLVFESEVLHIPKFPFLVGLKTENVLLLFCSHWKKKKQKIKVN